MEEYLSGSIKLVAGSLILIVVIIMLMNFTSSYENNKNFDRAIKLEDKYDIYYNGKLVKEVGSDSKFKVSALNKDEITIEVKDDVKEIYINDVQEDDTFFVSPVIVN